MGKSDLCLVQCVLRLALSCGQSVAYAKLCQVSFVLQCNAVSIYFLRHPVVANRKFGEQKGGLTVSFECQVLLIDVFSSLNESFVGVHVARRLLSVRMGGPGEVHGSWLHIVPVWVSFGVFHCPLSVSPLPPFSVKHTA